jgi:tape measure domain-containing protein
VSSDLEFRISAELTEVKGAIADLRRDLASLGALKVPSTKAFEGVEKGAKDAAKAADETKKRVRDATKPAGGNQPNPFQPVVDGAQKAEAAAKRVGDRVRDARTGRFVGGGAGGAGGASNPFAGVGTGADGALAGIKRLAAGLATAATALALIGKADELNTLNARLRLVTNSVEEYNRAQVALFDLAQRTRSGLQPTITLFSTIANATKDAKVGQETLLGVTETILKLGQISGAAGPSFDAALMQLGQGLASGTLRGEELNSILEQTPALADAIAKGMGITRGELRKYGEEGKITAEQVVNALLKQREEVDKQFDQLPLTVGQAVTVLKNAGLQLLGAFDQASGSTEGLAKAIKTLADFLSSDEVLGAIIDVGTTAGEAFSLAADAAEALLDLGGRAIEIFNDVVRAEFGASQDEIEAFSDGVLKLPRTVQDFVALVARAFKELPINIRAALKIVVVQAAATFDRLISYAQLVKDNFAAIFTSDTQDAAYARFQARNAAIEQASRDTVDDALSERDKALADAKKARDEAIARRRQGREATGSKSAGKFKPAGPSDKEKSEALALEKAKQDGIEKLAKDGAQRQVDILRELYDDSLTSARDYFAKREQIELAGIDAQIAAQRKLSTIGSPADRQKALTEIELLERQKGDIRRKVAREAVEAQREIDKQLEQARAQDLENAGKGGEAARIRLESQYRDLLKRLEAEGNATGVRLIRKLIDTGVAKAQFDDLQRQAEQAFSQLERRRAEIADRVSIGAISPAQGRQEEQVAREQALATLQALDVKIQELAATTNDPAIVEGANKIRDAIKRIGDEGLPAIDKVKGELRAALADMEASFAKTATNAGVDALTGLFTDLASGSKSAGDAVRDFARNFAMSMLQVAARALATYAVLQILEAIFPGAGRLVAASASVGATVKHGGGFAGHGMRRQVNPMVFAGAPRFHDGSDVLGLKPGEIPAILQQGERVQSRQEVAASRGGASSGGVRIVNAIDPAIVQDYMTSASGERTILNVIQRNSGAVRQTLA